MGAALIGAFVLLVGPVAYFYGADSRLTAKANRDWFAGRRRR